MSEYEYTKAVEVRYIDIDTQHIVNNGIYAHYLTEARVNYFEDVLGRVAEEIQDIVVAHLEIDFLKSLEHGDDVVVHLSCASVGRSSFTLEYELRVDDTPVARALTDHVTVNPETGESQSLPEDLRELLT